VITCITLAQVDFIAFVAHLRLLVSLAEGGAMDWQTAYEAGFEMYAEYRKGGGPRLDYYDPDTSHREDLIALSDAAYAKLTGGMK